MKKYPFVLLISAILSQFACAPPSTYAPAPPKTDREKAGLFGTVRTVISKNYPFLKTDTYDAKGNLIEQITDTVERRRGWPYIIRYSSGADGKRMTETVPTITDHEEMDSIYSKGAYSYYMNGNLAAKVSALNDGSFQDATFYLYDDNGTQDVVIHHASDHLVTRTEFEYDKYGNIIRESQYSTAFRNAPLAFRWETQHSYNLGGHRTETLRYGSEHQFEGKSVFEYDERGNTTEETEYDSKGAILRKVVSTLQYDSNGNWIQKKSKVVINPLNNDGKPTWRPEYSADRTITYHN